MSADSAIEFTELPDTEPYLRRGGSVDPNESTCILCGINRSGTSATAAVLHSLGVEMDGSQDGHFERLEFKDHCGEESFLKDRISQLNLKHSKWGAQVWAWGISDMIAMTKNPFLVLVTRDPTAIALRWNSIRFRNADNPKMQTQVICNQMSMIINHFGLHGIPTIMISFEKLKSHTRDVVRRLAADLHLPSENVDRACAVVNKGSGYLKQ